jgi:hypothetical protein
MRIAFVVHDYNRVFGHSRYVSELAERFRGVNDIHVFANTFDGDTRGMVTHNVPALRATALTTILSFYAMASTRVGGTFDIVHAQGVAVPHADVITAHISNARWLEGRRHLEGGELSWKEKLFGATVIPLERRTYQSSHATVVAVSETLANDIRTSYGRTGETVVIRHGVDFRQFNPSVRQELREPMRKEMGLADSDLLYLFVGDLRKGFAQAMAALPQAPGRLLGVSRTDPAEMLTRAGELGVTDRVRRRGRHRPDRAVLRCGRRLRLPDALRRVRHGDQRGDGVRAAGRHRSHCRRGRNHRAGANRAHHPGPDRRRGACGTLAEPRGRSRGADADR